MKTHHSAPSPLSLTRCLSLLVSATTLVLLLVSAATASAAATLTIKAAGYEYYCIGKCNTTASVPTSGGYFLQGGGLDVDQGFEWMINKAVGGDFLVLRASGTDAYNPWIWELANGRLNSVATLISLNESAAYDGWVESVVRSAAAVFLAGGDQWNYYSMWKATPLGAALASHVDMAPIGGTSAGMAVLGRVINTAQWLADEPLVSRTALADPYVPLVSLGGELLRAPSLAHVVTDTHFRERDRMGRLVVFVTRMQQDVMVRTARGIGCDEATGLLVEINGTASSVTLSTRPGGGSCYLLQATQAASQCEPGAPLSIDGIATSRVSGNLTNAFDLVSWRPLSPRVATYTLSARSGILRSQGNDGRIY